MMNRVSSLPARQNGFALVLGLWAAVIVLLLAGVLDTYVQARLEQAQLIRQRVQEELDRTSTENTLLYLLGTQRFTRAGLTTLPNEDTTAPGTPITEIRIDPEGGELLLDSSPYRGIGGAFFSLQDVSGLIALNSESQQELRLLLQSFDNDEVQIGQLLDTLADYRDSNSVNRLNGAEQDEYAAAGEPAPANFHLRSAPELLRVLGWRDWLRAHPDFDLHLWFSITRVAAFNPNVMPLSLLARLPGLNPEQADAIVAMRRELPFRALADFDIRADVELLWDEDQYRFFPSDTLHLRTWRSGAVHAEQLALQLTPLGQRGPWQITSSYRIRQGSQNNANEAPGHLFPQRSAPAP